MDKGELKWREVLERIAPYPSVEEIDRLWLAAVEKIEGKIIVLDDDPTGVQTVHSIPVYTSWDKETLKQILGEDDSKLCYILTNSRALTAAQTVKLHRGLAKDLREVAADKSVRFLLISRSDSTLRGHYPLETQTLYEELTADKNIDGEVIIPFFLEGGRLTIDDVHYVREGDSLVPAGHTEFARDSIFGYRASNLKEWIEEKTMGRYPARDILSISLEELRRSDTRGIATKLEGVTGYNKVIVNAVEYADLKVFFVGLVEALSKGKRFLFRTGASFVQVAGGVKTKELLTIKTLYPGGKPPNAGLVIVGSYVPKTTKQLRALQKTSNMAFIEWDVKEAKTDLKLNKEVERVVQCVEEAFRLSRDACVYTSRDFLGGANRDRDPEEDLTFSGRVSEGLVRTVRGLKVPPGFLVAKGGITSSDIGVKALGARRAIVIGQILPGVPVWELGKESRFPGLPYVIFPGNVGDENALKKVLDILKGT